MPPCLSRKPRTKHAVDGWLLASGKPPEITEVEKWYVDDSEIVFEAAGKVASAGQQQQNYSNKFAPRAGTARAIFLL